MAESLRFYLDENVDPVIAKALIRQGIEAITVVEANMRTASDTEQLEYARKHQLVVVTHDADFLRMGQREENHYGIVFCRKNNRSVGEMIRSLFLIHALLTPDELRGKIEFI
ncbi:MAG: DUF5615 family PIN-like protein [Candidatus Kapaibacterium sp.]